MEQTGTAKKLTGQILENWLVALADGHGGIQTIEKTGTSGLVDTYTITYADTTTSTFTVKNGKAISSITQYWAVSDSISTVPSQWYTTRQTMTVTNKYLWSYMHYAYNDGTSYDTPYSVIGVYGDTGSQTYVWIKYSAILPTSDADMADIPDKWIGIYVGLSSTAPTSYTAYTWYQYKGEKGDTGDASKVTAQSVTYLEGTSGTVVPQGSWTTTVPSVTPGNFLWTRTQLTFNDGTNITAYSVSRYGIDGTGSVSSVNNQSPDTNGNVALNASNIPTSDSESVQAKLDASATAVELATYVRPNLLDNWYFIRGAKQTDIVSFPVNQRRQNSYIGNQYGIDRWIGANANVTLGLAYSNYIVLKSSTSGSQNLLIQYFENKEWFAGKTVTISALVNNTLIKSTIEVPADSSTWGSTIGAESASVGGCSIYLMYLNSKLCFVFYGTNDYTANTNILLRAAKIEIGSTQTLAHQENGTWVLNEIPDYAAELAKCQRYYVRFDLAAWTNFGFVVGSTATVGAAVINLPQVMHKNPTVKFSGDVLAKSAISTTSANGRLAQSMVSANITTTDLELYGIFPLRSGANGAIVEMDADL